MDGTLRQPPLAGLPVCSAGAVPAAGVTILAAAINRKRLSLSVSNTHATVALYVRDDGLYGAGGIYLRPGFTVAWVYPHTPQGAITVTGAGAASSACWREGT
jgi:hypothetical protein